jgi:hypothetical protein
MIPDVTARHALPMLFVGQSQKETTHNEALVRIDALLHPVVGDTASTPPAALGDESDGLCWLVGAGATGVWNGRVGQIARWSAGSWRYVLPVDGMTLWHAVEEKRYFYIDGQWVSGVAISNPAGGAVVDTEARQAINAILDHLRQISSIPA